MVTIHPPSQPYRGLRGHDDYGSGSFGASRDGGVRRHLGQDYIAQPGDIAQSPIDGKVRKIGWAYGDTAALGTIEILGTGRHEGYTVRLLYVSSELRVTDKVVAGQPIGVVGDVAAYYAEKPGADGRVMTPHVHIELVAHVDPVKFMRNGLSVHE